MKLGLRRSFPVAFVLLSLAVTHAPASRGAVSAPPLLATPRVAPEAVTVLAHLARTGETFPAFHRNEELERTGRLPVVVRFLSVPSSERRHELEAAGVRFDRHEPIASGAWLATVDPAGLRALESAPDLARVSVDLRRRAPRPLERSLTETKADVAKRAAIVKDGEHLDGKGTVIADIDSPVYIHHPAFFRADGGTFPWVDVDRDGKLTPGVDGIDLDESGKIEPGEVLHDLRSTALSLVTGKAIEEHDTFQPDLDYLYLDVDGNGKRDYGEGFTEDTPAYGEPIFVFDDANHDGETQLTERVVQLATSKIRALSSGDKTYTRGEKGSSALIAYDPTKSEQLAEQMMHATGVAGILAGGQPGISRWLGLAPEAELLMNDSTSRRGMVSNVQWAIDQKADVILTEYAPYSGVTLDGSSEDELILDAANDQGIVTVSPAGNLAGGHKHRTVSLQPGSTLVRLATNLPPRYVAIAAHHKGPARSIAMRLKRPGGGTIEVPASAPEGIPQADGSYLYVMSQTTPRGTRERFVFLVAQTPLATGAYDLSLTLDAGPPLEVDLFAGDDVSSWAGGLSFDEDTPTRTICNPSTSDKTISVAAYVLHEDTDFYPAGRHGELASYSSRGPRLDGAPGIEIAAPDNPLSASPPNGVTEGVLWMPFGGTSGAGPHVAAAVALLKQARPKASAGELRRLVLDSASPLGGSSADESTVGRGKLDVARALDADVASGDLPKPKIEVVTPAAEGAEATLRVTARDDGSKDGLTARWDLDYDGTFDTDWLPLGEQSVPLNDATEGAKIGVKVEVRDDQGNLNGATAILEVGPPGSGAQGQQSTTTTVTEEGCGCRAAPRRAGPLALGALALAIAALARRRTRPTA